MKKTIALLLTVLATSAFAQGISEPIPTASPATGQRTQSLTLQDDDRSAPAQVFYQVTLSKGGRILKSLTILTDDRQRGTTVTEEELPYLSACDAASCSTDVLHSGFMLSVTPAVAPDGSVLTTYQIVISEGRPTGTTDTSSGAFHLSQGQAMTIPLNGLLLTIKARVV
jgi:hypothetical protein